MKKQDGISLISLLIVIILIFGCIFAFKYISNNKTENKNIPKDTYTTTNPTTDTKAENNNSNNASGLRKDFKQAMDSYEAFMDEYIAFIMKYNNSNKAAPEMIKDYAEYMKKLAEMGSAFEKWESNNLNKEESKYYVEVQMRVNQKLMNASIDIAY